MADEGLQQQIRQMLEASLVVTEADDRLAFRHALTREAVYSTLLRSERRHIHQVVAEAMRRSASAHGGLHDALQADLAYHYYEAEAWPQALVLAKRAGKHAMSVFAAREAAGHYTRALDAAEHHGIRNRSYLLHLRGRALETLGEFEPARADYEAERQCAQEENDGPGEWQALIDLGFLWAGRDYQQSGSFLRQALERARALHDPKTEAHSLNRLGNWLVNTGEPAEGIVLHSEALAVFRASGDRAGEAETLDLLCFAHSMQGDFALASASGEAAVNLLRSLDDPPALFGAMSMLRGVTGPGFAETSYTSPDSLAACERDAVVLKQMAGALGSPTAQAFVGIVLCHTLTGYGAFGHALALGQESLRYAESAVHQQWMTGLHHELGMTYFWMLDNGAAIATLEMALGMAHKLGSAWWIGHSAGYLALACVRSGDSARAHAVLSAEFALSRPVRTLPERRMLWVWGELALAKGEPSRALAIAEQLIDSAIKPAGATPPDIPSLWKLKGEALGALGRAEEARHALESAKAGALQRGSAPMLWQIHAALAQLHAQHARPELATRELASAREVVGWLCDRIYEPVQRVRFVRAAEAALAPAPPVAG